jgi:hypothetical protein
MDITQLNHSILNLARLNCRRFHCCCWELHWRLLAALVKIIRSLGDFILFHAQRQVGQEGSLSKVHHLPIWKK